MGRERQNLLDVNVEPLDLVRVSKNLKRERITYC